MTVMIYGANGYSGQLIAEQAKGQGIPIVVAGRNHVAVNEVADLYGCPARVFDLDKPSKVQANLKDIDVLINCAGPFSHTAKAMILACIATGTHYLDITGEVDVFEYAHSGLIDQKATEAGVVVCPGVGFDVIPTDCMAAALKQAMPDAVHLTLAFAGGSAMSPGTAKSSVEAMAQGLRVRQNGRITQVSQRTREVDFGQGKKLCMGISWGDISTAYHSTGIPNIEVYIPASPKIVDRMKMLSRMRLLFKLPFVQNALKSIVDKKVTGPSANTRSMNPTSLWGEVVNERGQRIQARLKTLNGYDVTQYGAVYVTQQLLNGTALKRGSVTPSLLLGEDLASKLPGSSPIELSVVS